MVSATAIDRRAALRLASGFGIGGLLFLERGARTVVHASHDEETRAIEIEWLSYTDAAGKELARIRPYWMNDVTGHDGIATPEGQRDLAVRLAVRNVGAEALVVSPAAFALWDERGFIVRPVDIYTDRLSDGPESSESRYSQAAAAYLIAEHPIPPRGEQEGIVTYRVPAESWFRGLLFMPEPERVLVLADFRREASAIID